LSGGEQDHASHLRKLESRSNIQRCKHGLYGNRVRRELFHQPRNEEMNFAKANRKRDAVWKSQRSKAHRPRQRTFHFDYAVSSLSSDRGVYAENTQLARLLRLMCGTNGHVSGHKCTCGTESEGSVFFDTAACSETIPQRRLGFLFRQCRNSRRRAVRRRDLRAIRPAAASAAPVHRSA
jgi:hypothetical protein